MKQYTLPMRPLSVNKAWQGRRYKTNDYKAWQQEAVLHLKPQVEKPLKGRLALTVEYYIKNDKTTDVDNLLKTLQDTLQLVGAIEDDRFIYEVHAYKYHSKNERIRITISKP